MVTDRQKDRQTNEPSPACRGLIKATKMAIVHNIPPKSVHFLSTPGKPSACMHSKDYSSGSVYVCMCVCVVVCNYSGMAGN